MARGCLIDLLRERAIVDPSFRLSRAALAGCLHGGAGSVVRLEGLSLCRAYSLCRAGDGLSGARVLPAGTGADRSAIYAGLLAGSFLASPRRTASDLLDP